VRLVMFITAGHLTPGPRRSPPPSRSSSRGDSFEWVNMRQFVRRMRHSVASIPSGTPIRSRQRTRASVKTPESREANTRARGGEHKEGDPSQPQGGVDAKLIGSLSVLGGLVALVVGGVLLKDQIKAFLDYFIAVVDNYGPLGYIAYMVVYAGLELFAVPAIPLTMTAGVIFGPVMGTAVVSLSATAAATGAFLISRYIARDRFAAWASQNPKFAAIDKAIGKDGFKVVALLRLSPLLPLAASNYLYGLTSVDLGSYVLASWIGMLPGTAAYVGAGSYGSLLASGQGSGIPTWQFGLGAAFTGLALWYIGNLAKEALAEIEDA
jgi:uncharacterized membrane protein YdjX (TVP38/TMEM64 family)